MGLQRDIEDKLSTFKEPMILLKKQDIQIK